MMRILLINHYAGSPDLGMEYRPYYLAREWVNAGHDVSIVASSFSHLRVKQPKVCAHVQEEKIDGITYIWLRTMSYAENGAKRAVNIFTFVGLLLIRAFSLVRKVKPDVVVASSTYPLDIIPAYIMARLSRAKLVYEIHDLWPLTLIEIGGMSKWHPFIMCLQIAENLACRFCDLVVSILPGTKPHLIEHGLEQKKFHYLPNGIASYSEETSERPLPESHESLFTKLENDNSFIVGYVGGHAISNALETLIEAAAQLRNHNVHFVLIGKGVEKQRLINRAADLDLNNVHFLPFLHKSLVQIALKRCHVLYIGFQKTDLYRFGVGANKFFDYMLSGRPIIQAYNGTYDLVQLADAGATVAPEDPVALAQEIERLSRLTYSELDKLGRRGREYVLRYHTYSALAQRFVEITTQ